MAVTVERCDEPRLWNDFVSSTPRAHFQQSWEWGELAPDLGGRAVRLAALENGSMAAAMQIFINPLSRTGMTHLYVPRGPSLIDPSPDLLGALFAEAKSVGQAQKAVGIRVEPDVEQGDPFWRSRLRQLDFRPAYPPSQPRSSWILDISPDEDTLLSNMKQKTRYNLRLAHRKGVSVSEGSDDDLDDFYELYSQTAIRDDFFIHPKSFYARMFDLFRRPGNFCMLIAKYERKPLAAVTLIRFGETCWYMHGASGNEHRNLMAPYLLQWHAIRWARSLGCQVYDFRAVPDILRDDQDMYGVYKFKEGFGGEKLTLMDTYSASYHSVLFGLWQLYFSGRFALDARFRRRKGLPARQFA